MRRRLFSPCRVCVSFGIAVSILTTGVVAGEPDGPDERNPTTSRPDASAKTTEKSLQAPPALSLIDAMRNGQVKVKAEGTGEDRMIMSLTNRTHKPLKVVLPPGLVVQGATGQFGGMGGMGGGMGGMGGGMGGMGGGMGGMGGGMGGMGGGMGGGMRGGMMGGMRGGGVMPPQMGMMIIARMIMALIERDSWDRTSLTMTMGGMGGMGMGGMGGMGMGGMGGMGGGMRSVPPTGLPHTTLKPGQTRELPTRLVSLSPPDSNVPGGLNLPAKGEPLRVGDASQITADPRVQKALRRLASETAPQTVSQLILWKLTSDADWDTISGLARPWANAYEIGMAEHFVEQLDSLPDDESGSLFLDFSGSHAPEIAVADELTRHFKDRMVLGLKGTIKIPATPREPAVACTVQVGESEAWVHTVASDEQAEAWIPIGKFSLPIPRDKSGKFQVEPFASELTEGILNRLVRAQLTKGPRVKGKDSYKLRIDNASPLVLNGLGVKGAVDDASIAARELSGICIPPRRSFTVPVSESVVRLLELKKGAAGVHVVAADLSGL